MMAKKALLTILSLAVISYGMPPLGWADGEPGTAKEEEDYSAREAKSKSVESFAGGAGVGYGGGAAGGAALALASLALYAVLYPVYKTGELIYDGVSSLVAGGSSSGSPR
jgi:hypothetical protein